MSAAGWVVAPAALRWLPTARRSLAAARSIELVLGQEAIS